MKIKPMVLLLSSFLFLVNGCGSTAKKAKAPDELDIAIREASNYLNENIPKGNKIAILNIESVSLDLSNYVIDELIANAVKDKVFSVVDRQQLDTLRAEQRFQLSGEVNDKDAVAIGKFLGAQTIVSGAVNSLGGGYRIRIRALAVQTAQVQGQFNRNITSSLIASSLIAGGSSSTASSTPTGSSGNPAAQTTTAQPTTPARTDVPGNTLGAKLAWLQKNVKSNTIYFLEAKANESIDPQMFEYAKTSNVTVVIKGDNTNRIITLRSNGTLMVRPGVTLIFDNNITLQGHSGNTAALIDIYGGTFIMNAGSAIIGNSRCGVFVADGGHFEMHGGTISGNTDGTGGGVQIYGVVQVQNAYATFTMNGGTITGNKAASLGGGVFVNSGCTFTMNGGVITGNTAREYGGGVCVYGTFTKNGGTITGYNSDPINSNAVKDDSGAALTRRGHAIFVNQNRRKETTAVERISLDSGANSGWDR